MELLEETTELEAFKWEPAVAKTEVEITMPADDIEAGRVRVSWRWGFCVKTSEGRLVGEDRVGEEGDKDEEEDTVWLLPSESGMLMKSIALPLPVLVCRGGEMMDGWFETGVLLVLRTTAGRLPGLASMAVTSCCAIETTGCCCTLILGLVIT